MATPYISGNPAMTSFEVREPMSALADTMAALCELLHKLPADSVCIPHDNGSSFVSEFHSSAREREKTMRMIEQTHAEMMRLSGMMVDVRVKQENKPK